MIWAAALLLVPAAFGLMSCGSPKNGSDMEIGKQTDFKLSGNRLTPEALWAMGRIGTYEASPDGKQIVYQVGYYSVKLNKSHQMLYVMNADGSGQQQLTTSNDSETDPSWIDGGKHIAYLSGGQLWRMNPDGSSRKQLTKSEIDIEGYQFSPDGTHVILLKSLPYHKIIEQNPEDLPLATGRVVDDLMYRHWDHYVETIVHPFVAEVNDGEIGDDFDMLDGQPYECPMEPFGGMEQLAWSPDGKQIAYTCRTKTGRDYSVSTDADIFLYDLAAKKARNLCKPADYKEPECDPTKSLRHQAVNAEKNLKNNPGYDQNPKFSPDGQYVAWTSMARDGYEADRLRLCVCTLATGEKQYVTESFDSNVDDYTWMPDSKGFYFIGVWHATENLYRTNLSGQVEQLTEDCADFGSLKMLDGKRIVAERHSYTAAADLYAVTPGKGIKDTKVEQITAENKHIFDQLALPTVRQRWVKTTDGKDMLYWIVLPPDFDESKQYPTLLFCEGGPQSPVSQFWSYRWNMMIMASNDYVIIAPNRRGLPGFGQEWLEEISGDWTGQCMKDYLTAIDDAAENLPYVNKDRMAAVGASFGGFSVYWLAGHHDKRFKCFIAHDGAFNLEAMYTETEENWFSNWEYDDAYWNKDQTANARKTYAQSPHRFVDKWDTPILCIHGEKDYRINATQGMSAFNAARMRGIEAQLLIFPDENHWVLKPQNGILWQRTYFNWLDRWLKKN